MHQRNFTRKARYGNQRGSQRKQTHQNGANWKDRRLGRNLACRLRHPKKSEKSPIARAYEGEGKNSPGSRMKGEMKIRCFYLRLYASSHRRSFDILEKFLDVFRRPSSTNAKRRNARKADRARALTKIVPCGGLTHESMTLRPENSIQMPTTAMGDYHMVLAVKITAKLKQTAHFDAASCIAWDVILELLKNSEDSVLLSNTDNLKLLKSFRGQRDLGVPAFQKYSSLL